MHQSSNSLEPKEWVSRYGELLLKYTLPRVDSSAVAEDLVQETFLSALKALNRYKEEASEKNWLFAILKHKIIDYYRRQSVRKEFIENEINTEIKSEWFGEDGMWYEGKKPKEWSNAENLAEKKELQAIIANCSKKLKLIQQKVFVLKYMEDQTSEDICNFLNISSTNYWILLHRARM